MDDETLNLSIRKFLKMVGVNSQREIGFCRNKRGLVRSSDEG